MRVEDSAYQRWVVVSLICYLPIYNDLQHWALFYWAQRDKYAAKWYLIFLESITAILTLIFYSKSCNTLLYRPLDTKCKNSQSYLLTILIIQLVAKCLAWKCSSTYHSLHIPISRGSLMGEPYRLSSWGWKVTPKYMYEI